MYHVTVARLQELLSELEALPPLPKACTPEALADHDNWMKRHEQVCELVRKAEYAALTAVPAEVAEALEAVYERKRALLHLRPQQEK
jgi:dihydroneopterin aldolase